MAGKESSTSSAGNADELWSDEILWIDANIGVKGAAVD